MGVEVTDVMGTRVLDSSALLSGGVYNTNADIVLTTDGIFVVDTMGPPDATISIEAVEGQGGYIN